MEKHSFYSTCCLNRPKHVLLMLLLVFQFLMWSQQSLLDIWYKKVDVVLVTICTNCSVIRIKYWDYVCLEQQNGFRNENLFKKACVKQKQKFFGGRTSSMTYRYVTFLQRPGQGSLVPALRLISSTAGTSLHHQWWSGIFLRKKVLNVSTKMRNIGVKLYLKGKKSLTKSF